MSVDVSSLLVQPSVGLADQGGCLSALINTTRDGCYLVTLLVMENHLFINLSEIRAFMMGRV